MKSLLVINSSARSERSITRRLTARFVSGWQRQHPDGRVISRDVGTKPPAIIDHDWIAAAFAREPLDGPTSPLAESEEPYVGLIPSKPVIVITSKGAGGYEPGGPYATMNFLEPHIAGIFAFLGLADTEFVKVEFEEFQDRRLDSAIARAERQLDGLLAATAERQLMGIPC